MQELGVQLVAGGVAGLADALLLHGFDTLKVRQQLATGPRLSLVQHARLLLAEGPLSLYRGIGPVVSTIVPKVAVRFAAFHGISSIVSGGDDKTSFLGNLAAGMGAGVVEALLVVTPSEVVKVRMQDVAASARCTQLQMLRRVLQESGVRGLYRGCVATTLRQAGQQGCKFAFFYQFRDRLAALGLAPGSTSDVIAGALANSVGAVMNTPLDVVKSRIQRQSAGETKYRGLLRSFVIVYREEGIGALSKGLTARLWRIAPAGAVQFFVFEKVKKLLTCFVCLKLSCLQCKSLDQGGVSICGGPFSTIFTKPHSLTTHQGSLVLLYLINSQSN